MGDLGVRLGRPTSPSPVFLFPGPRLFLRRWSWGPLAIGTWDRVGALNTTLPASPSLPIPQSRGSAHRMPRSHPLHSPTLSQGDATSWGAGSGFLHPARPPGTTWSVPTSSPCPGVGGKFTKQGGQAGRVLAPPLGF